MNERTRTLTPRTDELIASIRAKGLNDFQYYLAVTGEICSLARQLERELSAPSQAELNATGQQNKAGSSSETGADFKATDSGADIPAADSQSRGLPNNAGPVAPSQAVPEGYVMVPREPTVDMLQAAVHALDGVNLSRMTKHQRATFKARKRWEAMLRSHLTSPVEEQQEPGHLTGGGNETEPSSQTD